MELVISPIICKFLTRTFPPFKLFRQLPRVYRVQVKVLSFDSLEAYSEPCRTSTMELFAKFSQELHHRRLKDSEYASPIKTWRSSETF